jgi:hypothetical protein
MIVHFIVKLGELRVDSCTASNKFEIPTGHNVNTHNHCFGKLRNANFIDLKAHFGIHSLKEVRQNSHGRISQISRYNKLRWDAFLVQSTLYLRLKMLIKVIKNNANNP